MFTSILQVLPLLALTPSFSEASWLPAKKYVLEELYSGPNFFDGWNFFDGSDPTHGFVQYVNESTAASNGLIDASHGPAYIGVDYTSKLKPNGTGRQSVRISSNRLYNESLIIGDFLHMPGGICGTWPAFWSFSATVDWPLGGEIDIIEGIHTNTNNQATLHTGPNCNITGEWETGTLLTTDCAVVDGNGCSVVDERNSSYGKGFNANQGGVYATQWTDKVIRIWFFPRSSIPSDIQAKQPNPNLWGEPTYNFQGSCSIPSHFFNHQIVFDTTFCGDWAGPAWANYPTCTAKAATCNEYVAEHPHAFKDAYWLVNYVAVYQQETIAHSSTSVAPTTGWPTTWPWGFPQETMIPVAAGQVGGGGHWGQVTAAPVATTTAVLAQAPATAAAAATITAES